MTRRLLLAVVLSAALSYVAVAQKPDAEDYGVDVSFPMHYFPSALSSNVEGEAAQESYRSYLQTCRSHYKDDPLHCDSSERDRINMNFRQPSSMQNYTSAGYAKVKAPKSVTKLLSEVWDKHQETDQVVEKWEGNSYVNHWESPTYLLSLSSSSLEGKLISSAQETLEAWTGQSLQFTSLYGIRVYKDGAILAPHVDRLPLVTSCIINVAQEVDEPWMLELVGHDGKAHNVTLQPGEMVLYESASVIHGRPYPLKGSYYANVFLHFEPYGHSQRHAEKHQQASGNIKSLFQQALEHKVTNEDRKRSRKKLPDYIEPGTPQQKMWSQEYAYQLPLKDTKKPPPASKAKSASSLPPTSPAHQAASRGNIAKIKEIAQKDRKLLHAPDRNGWKPLHEAARGGNSEIVEYLILDGADVNERTNNGKGGNALWWAEQQFGENHHVVKVLKKYGAKNIPPNPDFQ